MKQEIQAAIKSFDLHYVGEVDMRQKMTAGQIFWFDLLKLPPQPKSSGHWTIRQGTDMHVQVGGRDGVCR